MLLLWVGLVVGVWLFVVVWFVINYFCLFCGLGGCWLDDAAGWWLLLVVYGFVMLLLIASWFGFVCCDCFGGVCYVGLVY